MSSNKKILMLPGDGIGPEVMHEVARMIDWMNDHRGTAFEVQEDLAGGAAYDAHGTSLTNETMAHALASDAVLFGSVGGPKWDNVPREERPETDCCGCARKWICSPICARPLSLMHWPTRRR